MVNNLGDCRVTDAPVAWQSVGRGNMSQKPRRASTGTVNLARSLIEVCRGTSSQSTEDADCTLDKVLWDVFSEHEDILDMLTTAGLSCSAEDLQDFRTELNASHPDFELLKSQLQFDRTTDLASAGDNSSFVGQKKRMRSVSAPPRFTPPDSSVLDLLSLPFELPQLPTLDEASEDGRLHQDHDGYPIMSGLDTIMEESCVTPEWARSMRMDVYSQLQDYLDSAPAPTAEAEDRSTSAQTVIKRGSSVDDIRGPSLQASTSLSSWRDMSMDVSCVPALSPSDSRSPSSHSIGSNSNDISLPAAGPVEPRNTHQQASGGHFNMMPAALASPESATPPVQLQAATPAFVDLDTLPSIGHESSEDAAARETIQSYIAYRLSNGAQARPTSEAAAQFSYSGPQNLTPDSSLGSNTGRAQYTAPSANGQPTPAAALPSTPQHTRSASAPGSHAMHQHMNGGSYSFTGGAARPSESPPLAYSAPPQQAPPLSGYHSLPAEMPLLAQLGNLAAGSMSADQYASCMYILQQQYLLGRQQALLENRAQAGARSNDMLRAFQQIQAAPASPQCTTPSTPFMHAGAQADSTPRAAENRSTPHSGLVFNPLNLGTTSYPNLSTPPQPASEAHNLHNAGHPTRPTTLARQASAPLSSSPVQQTLHHHFTPLPALSSYSFDAISMPLSSIARLQSAPSSAIPTPAPSPIAARKTPHHQQQHESPASNLGYLHNMSSSTSLGGSPQRVGMPSPASMPSTPLAQHRSKQLSMSRIALTRGASALPPLQPVNRRLDFDGVAPGTPDSPQMQMLTKELAHLHTSSTPTLASEAHAAATHVATPPSTAPAAGVRNGLFFGTDFKIPDHDDQHNSAQRTESSTGNVITSNDVTVTLDGMELWQEFSKYGNEMITSSRGRHMFPVIKLQVTGLAPTELYAVCLHFFCDDKDDEVWKWSNSEGRWVQKRRKAAKSNSPEAAAPEAPKPQRRKKDTYCHPASPRPGSFWMTQLVAFDKLRLTNRNMGADFVFLESFHKYTPIVYILPVNRDGQPTREAMRFPLHLCSFIAATAYHNRDISKLKILKNPMAKSQQYQFTEDQGGNDPSSDDGLMAALRPPSPRGKRKASNPDIAEGMLLSLKSFR